MLRRNTELLTATQAPRKGLPVEVVTKTSREREKTMLARPPETYSELFTAMRQVLGPDEYFSLRVDGTEPDATQPVEYEIKTYVAKLAPNGWSKNCQSFQHAWHVFCGMVGHDSGTMEMKMVDVVVGVDDCV